MTIIISCSYQYGARLDGPSTGTLLMELRVVARELDWGGAMLCLLRCPASEDDIDRKFVLHVIQYFSVDILFRG